MECGTAFTVKQQQRLCVSTLILFFVEMWLTGVVKLLLLGVQNATARASVESDWAHSIRHD